MIQLIKKLFKRGFDPSLVELSDEQMANTWGAGGGQSVSGESVYNWNPFMENMWGGGKDGNPGLLNRAVTTLNSPYESYGGKRIADFTGDQNSAMNLTRHTASGYGAPDTAAGRQAAMEIAQGGGKYASNPWGNLQVSEGQNQFMGDNPFYRSLVSQGAEDITSAYQKGTAADTQRAFATGGALGGSAHQQAIADNQAGLGKSLGNYMNQMGSQQFDRSANLREADLSRNLSAQQFNKQIGSSLFENAAQRQLQAIPLAFQGQNLSFDAANQLMNMGDRQQRQSQLGLDNAYQDWATGQNWERNNINWMANLLAQAQGGIGGQATQTQPGYGINPIAGLLGAGALYGGMS